MTKRLFYAFALLMLMPMGMLAQEAGADGSQGNTVQNHNLEVGKNLDIFNTVFRNLDLLYVDTINPSQAVTAALKGLTHSLDPYTEYYPESETKNLQMMITGKYAGIGSLIKYHSKLKRVVVDEPYEGMPAAEVGLKKGDIILSIDDSLMTDKQVSYVSSRLRGDAGTSFMLKVKRPSTGKEMKFKITRRNIKLPELPYYGLLEGDEKGGKEGGDNVAAYRTEGAKDGAKDVTDGTKDDKDGEKGAKGGEMGAKGDEKNGEDGNGGRKIGYINLNQFTEGCARSVRNAFIDLKQQGAQGLVLDLRGNGGGSEMEAVDIVSIWVPKDELVVENRGKVRQASRSYRTRLEPIDTVMPLVVLVNGETASASEITAGALQDLDRAVIIGTRTYGKGLVQVPLDMPYNTNLKVTTSKYFIPSGRCIQAINYRRDGQGAYKERIADSLTHVFHTRAGREVRDGGGIKPDMEVKADSLPNIAYYLSIGGLDSTEVLFDYVVDYISRHPQIAPAAEFRLTDADYDEFCRRVVESGFSYDDLSRKRFDELVKTARFEGYYDEAREAFDALSARLHHDVATELRKHRAPIQQMLEADIVGAYYYQSGMLRSSLRSDNQLREARRLLSAPDAYNRVLKP